jgi:hypothetical protein
LLREGVYSAPVMERLAYTVIATLPDAATATEYAEWLVGGHVQQVLAGGALRAAVVRVEGLVDRFQVESRYVFENRADFDRYVAETAPKLRAEGLLRFPPARGVAFERRIATVVWEGCRP